ncbi:MAG TPA: MBL fold metallo-hydrolase [Longimicrobium sp.]|nr:MBL fold metallo-hydrolase [Longimicrobium sp.]
MATTLLPEVMRGDPETEVTHDVLCLRTGIVNLFLWGPPGAGDREWVLVDAGLYGSAERILRAAEERFGPGARPAAIILTHGHFDHVGALPALADLWDAPIYAHPLEVPYLTGRSAYPPPDPTVGGGAMARLSPLYPRGPYDFTGWLDVLPADGSVPGMPGWRWIHTPGHTPGHVALFREADRLLIAGDAFVTTKQESLWAVLEQRPEIHGPPAYYTIDWDAARRSVELLALLEPAIAATGHGPPLRGEAMTAGLRLLARDFEMLAVPDDGRYVRAPAITDETGVVSVPPAVHDNLPLLLALGGALALGAVVGGIALRSREPGPRIRIDERDLERYPEGDGGVLEYDVRSDRLVEYDLHGGAHVEYDGEEEGGYDDDEVEVEYVVEGYDELRY